MNAAIIVAGGSGERMGLTGGKQLATIAGRPVLSHTLESFDRCDSVDSIVVVVHPDRVEEYRRDAVDPIRSGKVTAVVGGGSTRQLSVSFGLKSVPEEARIVIVHDGARPLVTPELISRVVTALADDPALDGIVVGHPSYDTLKAVDAAGRITATPDRRAFWAAQTPQAFRAEVLRRAYAVAADDRYEGTDDASLVERAGGVVHMLAGPRDNIKITVPEDVLLVERLLEARAGGGSCG